MAPPINDDFADAIVVLDGILEEEGIAGTIVDATEEADWEVLGGYTPGVPVVWYRFETPAEATKLYWKITKTGGETLYFPTADLFSGPATPADFDDLVYEASIGDGEEEPPADFAVLAASTHYYVISYNYNFDGFEGDYTIDFQLVPSSLYEEWEELDPAIWEINNNNPPTGEHWTISSAEAFSGTTSVKYEDSGVVGTRRLIYQDEAAGNQNGVEYWLAYKFMVEDWGPVWDDAGSLPLPGFLIGPNSQNGTLFDLFLEADSATTGVLWTSSDGDFDSFPINTGQWYELRLMAKRTGINAVISEFLDGAQISNNYAWGTLGANPSGVFWRSVGEDGVLYVDPLIYQVGSDPGPIVPGGGEALEAPFIAATTTVFTPVMEGDGNVDLGAPFIASETEVFDAYLSGDMDIPAPFIASETEVFSPFLLGPDRARLSQLPVEVVLAPDDADARLSQLPVEVVLAPDDAAARLSQLPVEVVQRALRESVIVTIID